MWVDPLWTLFTNPLPLLSLPPTTPREEGAPVRGAVPVWQVGAGGVPGWGASVVRWGGLGPEWGGWGAEIKGPRPETQGAPEGPGFEPRGPPSGPAGPVGLSS